MNDDMVRDGMGAGGFLLTLLIVGLLFGAGNGGGLFGGGGRAGDYGQFATSASQQEILFGQHFQDIDNKLDRLGNGIADATFSLNGSIGAVGTQVLESKYDNALRIDAVQAKMQECCCATQQAIHAEGEATRAMIREGEIARLREENQSLRFAVNQQEQNGQILGAMGRWVANPPCQPYQPVFGCGCGMSA